jgi:arsenite methyltransferase
MRSTPYTSFSERDLVQLARGAGFAHIHMELHINHRPHKPMAWEVFLEVTPHPYAPSLREILRRQFTPEERKILEPVLRPKVESQHSLTDGVIAYLTAVKSEVG